MSFLYDLQLFLSVLINRVFNADMSANRDELVSGEIHFKLIVLRVGLLAFICCCSCYSWMIECMGGGDSGGRGNCKSKNGLAAGCSWAVMLVEFTGYVH